MRWSLCSDSLRGVGRGDIVWAADPLSEKGRPLLVLGTPRFSAHGLQLITTLISTKSYHEKSITLRDEDYDGEPLGKRSHVLPWSLVTLTERADSEASYSYEPHRFTAESPTRLVWEVMARLTTTLE